MPSRSSSEMPLRLTKCLVRPWRLEDAASLTKHANNRNVWLRLRDKFPHPYTIADANKFLEKATTAKPITAFCLEIENEVAGGIGVRLGEDVHRHVAEVGYWLGEPFWGQGIMSEVLPAFTQFCWDNFQLRRIQAETYANNPASARVLEKSGFLCEGRLRNNVCKDGKVIDSILYAVIR